jgi:hypothetical protein
VSERKCFEPQDSLEADCFTHDHPELASCAALFSAALAPYEGTNPLAFACEALRQISADLCVFEHSLSDANENGEGPLSHELVRRFIAGIEGRARVASEVARRLGEARGGQQETAENDSESVTS